MATSQAQKPCCITVHESDEGARKELIDNWGWLMALGALAVLLGTFAALLPGVAGLAFAAYVGVLFVLLGVVELIHAFKARKRGGFGWNLISALLSLAGGTVALAFPFSSLVALTLFLGLFLASRGVQQALVAFSVKPTSGWGWLLFSGVISLLLAAMILLRLPSSATWVIGLFLGLEIMFRGWAMVSFSLLLRQLKRGRSVVQPAT